MVVKVFLGEGEGFLRVVGMESSLEVIEVQAHRIALRSSAVNGLASDTFFSKRFMLSPSESPTDRRANCVGSRWIPGWWTWKVFSVGSWTRIGGCGSFQDDDGRPYGAKKTVLFASTVPGVSPLAIDGRPCGTGRNHS